MPHPMWKHCMLSASQDRYPPGTALQNPPIDATSDTPSTDASLYLTYQSCIDLKVPRSCCLLSRVYQNTCPTPVPSGPSVGVTPPGNCALTVLSLSSTLVRAKYISCLLYTSPSPRDRQK